MANKLHRLSGLALTGFSLQRTHISSPLNACKLRTTSAAFLNNNHNESKQLHKLHVPPHSSKHDVDSSYDQAIRSLVLLRNTDKALELMEKARWRTNSLTYEMVLSALCKASKLKAAVKLFHKMLALKVTPSAYTISDLVKRCCRSGKIDEAKGIIKQVDDLGIFLGDLLLVDYLGALCRNRTEEANQVLKEMAATGYSANALTYHQFMLDMHIKSGSLDAAVALFEKVSTMEVKISAYKLKTLLNHLLTMGEKIETIATVLERLSSNGVASTIEIYSALVNVPPRDGLSWKEQMQKCGFNPDSITYNSLIRRLSEVQNAARVEEVVRLMSDRGLAPNLETYNILIGAYGLGGQFDKCFQILQEMEHKGHEPNEIIYASLLSCLCQKGKLTDALRLLDKMSKAGISPSPDLYNTRIYWYDIGPQVLIGEELAHKLPSQGAEVKAGEPAKVETEDGRILHVSQDVAEAGDESDCDDSTLKNEKQTKKKPAESGTETFASEKTENLVTPTKSGEHNEQNDKNGELKQSDDDLKLMERLEELEKKCAQLLLENNKLKEVVAGDRKNASAEKVLHSLSQKQNTAAKQRDISSFVFV